ncbi:MAG TPA: threonine/serine exporter family protein [Symbiobacteriaceae bacterium]|nr:threonine/serine exporter family protein [Symbiobacteriaceae bacterium]
MSLQAIAAFLSSFGFAILFQVPRRQLIPAGLAGALGWMIYLVSLQVGLTTTLGTFAAALVIGLLCRGWALVKQDEAAVLVIPAIIPMVPGTIAYQAHLAALAGRFPEASRLAVETALYGGAIALGLGLAKLLTQVDITMARRLTTPTSSFGSCCENHHESAWHCR